MIFSFLKYWIMFFSIKRYGINTAVLVSEDGRVLDGNRRVHIAKRIGIKVPVYVVHGRFSETDASNLIITCHPIKR